MSKEDIYRPDRFVVLGADQDRKEYTLPEVTAALRHSKPHSIVINGHGSKPEQDPGAHKVQ